MSHSSPSTLIVSISVWIVAASASPSALAGPVIAPGWGAPVFRDEFDGNTIDYSAWELGNFSNQANNEQQHYHPDQVLVYDGGLHLWAERDDNWTYGRNFNSGHVRTWQEWSYGRFEVRAKLPYGQGFWPAIWLLPRTTPWPAGGEIDIMEARGDLPYRMSSALHWGWDANSRQYRSQAYESGANFQAGYHDYAVEWEVGTVRFYVDGVNHYTLYEPDVGIPGTPKSLILNLAVGGDYSGPPNGSTPFPMPFDIEYVRVWQRQQTPPPPTSLLADAGFEDNDGAMDNWGVFGDSIGNVFSDWGTPLDGERSLKLYGQFNGEENYSGAFQNIAVSGGSTITADASALIRSEDSIVGSTNQALMKIEFYSEAGAEYGSEFFLDESIVTLVDGASPEDTWLNQSLSVTAPFDAVEARLAFVFVQPSDDGGAVFVDSVSLFESLALLGDYNANGVVDTADYTIWRDNEGATGLEPWSPGDGDGDGDIDADDYEVWAANLGATLPSTSLSVPEPATSSLVLTLLHGRILRRRR